MIPVSPSIGAGIRALLTDRAAPFVALVVLVLVIGLVFALAVSEPSSAAVCVRGGVG